MEHLPNKASRSGWHGLMYSTAILLIVCGIPAAILLSFVFIRDRTADLDRSQTLLIGLCMIVAQVLVAGILLFLAGQITRRLRGNHTVENETDDV